jgi:hypothetical protein
VGYARQDLNIMDPAATACGVPCEQVCIYVYGRCVCVCVCVCVRACV